MTKAIVSLSGGMDSTTVLADAISQGREVISCVGFNYGSKHNPHELEAGKQIATHYKTPYSIIDLRNAMYGFKSALMDHTQAIPEGHYEAENMRQTVVPARNIIFLSLLAGEAWSRGAGEIWLGIHSEQRAQCRVHACHTALSIIRDDPVGHCFKDRFQFICPRLCRSLQLPPFGHLVADEHRAINPPVR